MEDNVTDKEAFETEFRVFVNAVSILSEPADKQCELMGHYNVAWELKDDVSAGLYLMNNTESNLSHEQKYSIQQLVDELEKIPENVLSFTNIIEDCQKAMSHPCWEPLRKHASILLRSFE
jgi:hypothetical protein